MELSLIHEFAAGYEGSLDKEITFAIADVISEQSHLARTWITDMSDYEREAVLQKILEIIQEGLE